MVMSALTVSYSLISLSLFFSFLSSLFLFSIFSLLFLNSLLSSQKPDRCESTTWWFSHFNCLRSLVLNYWWFSHFNCLRSLVLNFFHRNSTILPFPEIIVATPKFLPNTQLGWYHGCSLISLRGAAALSTHVSFTKSNLNRLYLDPQNT